MQTPRMADAERFHLAAAERQDAMALALMLLGRTAAAQPIAERAAASRARAAVARSRALDRPPAAVAPSDDIPDTDTFHTWIAVGILMDRLALDLEAARAELSASARRLGVTDEDVATYVRARLALPG